MKKSRFTEDQRWESLTPRTRMRFVTWAIEEKCYSQRLACSLVGLDPKTCRYGSRRPDDAAVRMRLKELALERRRFGGRADLRGAADCPVDLP